MEDQPTMLGLGLVAGPDADAEEVAEATLQLRRELLDLDVDAVEVPSEVSRRRVPGRWTWRRLGLSW